VLKGSYIVSVEDVVALGDIEIVRRFLQEENVAAA
jgi:hypothetical protein